LTIAVPVLAGVLRLSERHVRIADRPREVRRCELAKHIAPLRTDSCPSGHTARQPANVLQEEREAIVQRMVFARLRVTVRSLRSGAS